MPRTGSVLIIGGGVVGCAAAYYLAREGVEVTLLERQHPGWGASSRNAGVVSLITRSAGPQLSLAMAGRRLWDELASELDDFDFRASGTVNYYFEEQAGFIDAFAARRTADGVPAEVISADDARGLCPLLPDDLAGAVWSPSDAYLHPEKLMKSLSGAAAREGVKIVNADVEGLEISSGRCEGVRSSAGSFRADVTVLAAGPWTPELLRPHDLPLELIGIRSQLAVTEPIDDVRFDVALHGPSFFHEYEFVRDLPEYDEDAVLHPLQRIIPEVGLLELFSQRADGRIVLGCPMELVPGDRATVAGMALTFAILADHVPAMRHFPVEGVWAGLIPQTGDGLPVVDAVSGVDGLFVGTGHAYGVATGPISGKLLAQMIQNQPVGIDMTPFRYDRPAITTGLGRTVSL
jgi:glycine/D-amino acid oxidase-like deaminating enzyme